ncbi:hsp90 co-chaperone Cdc37 [Puccinia graminis f. sp. tritici]|uniref:Hsp90 chaperone protein kinase-targeting subunit n=1 Tax=Puccinia graminis f. sp. tritici TaxID=56615 RepID=A0A5B0S3U9_PUCGR|nr:hsp90 co-chaperone Cdc37 [Puccinia graminis f. sp. tritici]
MPLNYSKWDALELSDDSDIECHPNVDKRSFIRLKQRQIHQKRDERKMKIDGLKKEGPMNAALLEKIEELVAKTKQDGADHLRKTASKLSAEGHAKPPSSSEDQPSIDQMIFNLISQILTKIKDVSPADSDQAAEKELNFHLNRLADREKQRKVDLEKEELEAHKHITSEDIHDGFDVSHVDKKPSVAIDEPITASSQSKSTKKVKKTNIEVLNPKASGTSAGQDNNEGAEAEGEDSDVEDSDDEELPRLSPSAQKFAKIKSSDYSSSLSAIQADPSLYLNESTTDALLVEAFESEMKGKKSYAKNCVHQGLLLQYCRKLGRDGVSLFFRKVGSGEPKAMQVFIDDVNSTYDRISKRCAVIIAERSEAPTSKEQIQLVPTNPTTSITFEVPDGPPPENLELKTEDPAEAEQLDVEEVRKFLWDRWNTFNQFPKKLQKALKSKKLDQVNLVIGDMEIPEAEKIVQDLDRVGILCFTEGGIIDKTAPDDNPTDPSLTSDQPADSTPQATENGSSASAQVVIPDTLA